MNVWTFDRVDRLTLAVRHARDIRDALRLRRCDHVNLGDWHAVRRIDRRIEQADARFRRLSTEARRERRGWKLVTA